MSAGIFPSRRCVSGLDYVAQATRTAVAYEANMYVRMSSPAGSTGEGVPRVCVDRTASKMHHASVYIFFWVCPRNMK